MDNLLSGRRVLVVEDEMLVLLMIEVMLSDLGCESITSAATVDQAIALIKEQTFDVAMLDVNLKGTDSRPVADVLAARGVPFFFATANWANRRIDGHAGRDVLRKPFKHEDLAAILTSLLSSQAPAL